MACHTQRATPEVTEQPVGTVRAAAVGAAHVRSTLTAEDAASSPRFHSG